MIVISFYHIMSNSDINNIILCILYSVTVCDDKCKNT